MATQTQIPNVAALKQYLGQHLGVSDWLEVSQERIERFAQATDDYQWIHVDPERAARESPFGRTIAHGYLTLALAPVLLAQILELKSYSAVVNAGLERMRLSAPVPAGSRVRMHADMKGVRDMPRGAARCVVHLRFEVEGSSKPACIADAVYVYYP